MTSYGVLGGTFDPVHLGHLHAARCVRLAFALPEVVLVPAAIPPHKGRPGLAPAAHRLAMVRLAAREEAWLTVSTAELDRGGVSYTIDTLTAMRHARPDATPLFILGVDAFLELRTWREPEALVHRFDLVVVDRPGSSLPAGAPDPELASLLQAVPFSPAAGRAFLGAPRPPEGRVFRLEIPPCEISSSEVRRCVARGAPLDLLVPPAVARYIQDQGLYVMEGRP
ncbi:MAG TPA: nicotinate-nucleotide adenylyltransferase [Candidatus Polarisedimenticolaceae bacterium]|nr:nicotinate-nucleotide adenylyltransferase [Candidatus Polarisedimenticolaceae bacterium]